MNRRAFTLIELLAVIVILAIIALIAVPIVVNIINDSKKSSQKESINMYAKAIEDGVANYFLKNPNKKEVPTIEELKNGNYLNYTGNVNCEETIIYQNGKIYLDKCTVDGTLVTHTYGEKESICRLVKKNGNKDINPGDEYTCEVIKGMEESYTFYVLGIEGEGKNQKVNLIMDRNICGTNDENNGKPTIVGRKCTIAWYSSSDDESNGPVTAMQGIYNATKDWDNVPDMEIDYLDKGHVLNNNYGYGKIETTSLGIKITKKDGVTEVTRDNNQTPVILYEEGKPLKARLPKLEEVYSTKTNDTTLCHYSDGSCPAWLTNGLKQYSTYYPDNDHISGLYGYWTLSSHSGVANVARNVNYLGRGDYYTSTSNANNYGIRAVITISLSDLL